MNARVVVAAGNQSRGDGFGFGVAGDHVVARQGLVQGEVVLEALAEIHGAQNQGRQAKQ